MTQIEKQEDLDFLQEQFDSLLKKHSLYVKDET